MDNLAIVVGGASGIGAAVADQQRNTGLDVVVWDVAHTPDIYCDITEPGSVDHAVQRTMADHGVPAYVTITAGVGHSGPLLTVSPEEWDRVFAVNTRGVWLAMCGLARPMLEAGGGSIVVTSSISARLADQTMGAYCASKAALDMLARVAALEWAPLVRVNAIGPGVTETPMLGRAPRDGTWLSGVARRTPLQGLGTPDAVAEAVVELHRLRWVTGQTLLCDGGLSQISPIDPLGTSSAT